MAICRAILTLTHVKRRKTVAVVYDKPGGILKCTCRSLLYVKILLGGLEVVPAQCN